MYHLDIPKTRQYDTGKIEVVARSSAGEAVATTELKIIPRHDDYRGVLKNAPRREWFLHITDIHDDKSLKLILFSILIMLSKSIGRTFSNKITETKYSCYSCLILCFLTHIPPHAHTYRPLKHK